MKTDMLTLESLGLTQEEIAERVVAKAVEVLLTSESLDEDGEEIRKASPFSRALKKRVVERIDQAVEEISGRHVLPNVAAYVEGLCLQETNRWGEKTGKPVTFVEYLVARAEAYLREDVNHEGKAKGEDAYSWRASGTRIAYMVHKHLQYSIQIAIEQALKDANAKIVGGIEQAVKIKLAEVADALKVQVKI